MSHRFHPDIKSCNEAQALAEDKRSANCSPVSSAGACAKRKARSGTLILSGFSRGTRSRVTNNSVQVLFWSGADFDEDELEIGTGKFKDASIRYTSAEQIDTRDPKSWLKKSRGIQRDRKNNVKRKGLLERLK